MSTDTSVTIALGLAQQMAGTHQPNTGMLQPGSAVPAAQAASTWYENQSGLDFADMTVDAAWSGGSGGLVDATACGCTVALLSFVVANGASMGVTLRSIAEEASLNPYVTLGSLYPNLWADFTAAVANALPNGVQNNDPFGAFDVHFPLPETIEQKIVADVDAAEGVTPTPAQESAAEAAVAADIQPAPGAAKKQ